MSRKPYTPGGDLTQAFVDLIDAGNAQAQLILKAIAQHADWTTGECFPRAKALADIGKCSVKTVRRYLKQMEKDGLIATEARFADGDDGSGRRTTNKITLVGFAEWASANRAGGIVKPPVKVTKYDDPASGDQGTGQEDHGTGQGEHGTGLNGSMANVGSGTGHSESPGALPNKVTSANEPHSNSHCNLSPLPPRSRKRSRGARERDEIDLLIEGLHNRTGCAVVTRVLIEPIVRARKLAMPDPAHVLAQIADWAKAFPDDVLDAARFKVLEGRYAEVWEEHITRAVKEASVLLGDGRPLDRPGAKHTLRGVFLSAAVNPEALAAWEAYLESAGADYGDPAAAQHRINLGLLRNYGSYLAPTEFPPGMHAIDGGVPQ